MATICRKLAGRLIAFIEDSHESLLTVARTVTLKSNYDQGVRPAAGTLIVGPTSVLRQWSEKMLQKDPPEDAVVTSCKHLFCNQCICEHLSDDDNHCLTRNCKVCLSVSSVFSEVTPKTSISEGMGTVTDNFDSQTVEPLQPCSERGRFGSYKIKAAVEVLQSLTKTQNMDFDSGSSSLVSSVGEKVIVSSQWTRMLDLLESSLKDSSISYRRLDGKMSVRARENAVKDFSTQPKGALGASAFLGRRRLFSTSALSGSGSSPTHFLSREEFLSNDDVKKVIFDYKNHLLSHDFGIPVSWCDAESEYDNSHEDFLDRFNKLQLYVPQTYMTKWSYMSCYLRSTLDDLEDLLYFMYQQQVNVAARPNPGGPGNNFVHIIRLSALHFSHEPAYILRTDASVTVPTSYSLQSGYGILLTSPFDEDPLTDSGNSTSFVDQVSSKICVQAAELYALKKGLEFALAKKVNVDTIRVLSDCEDIVSFILGKRVWIENHFEILNLMCDIGRLLKKLKKYSVSHIFRENDLECDYLAAMGMRQLSTSDSDVELFTSVPAFRRQGTFQNIHPVKSVIPPLPPSWHRYKKPANQPPRAPGFTVSASGGSAAASASGGASGGSGGSSSGSGSTV